MGRRSEKARSKTLPSSPSHSSSSSDFEFTISASPRKTSAPADELFYKGQLLPLHQSPRLSMVRTLLLANSSSTSSSSTASDPRDSTGSSSFSSDLALLTAAGDCDSSRPSPVEEHQIKKCNKYYYFPLSRFSSVFKKENKNHRQVHDSTVVTPSSSSVKRTAREVIKKYLKKVKPLYEKLSLQKQPQQQKMAAPNATMSSFLQVGPARDATELARSSLRSVDNSTRGFSHSFSGNLRYPRRKSCVSSCPSSMRSSPSHSGVLSRSVVLGAGRVAQYSSDMDELQSAIQGAIAHCKNSMMQKTKAIDRSVIKENLRTN